MGLTRTHVVLPTELLSGIDALVGPRGRSTFLAETAAAELRRRSLLEFLRSDQGWKDEDHPEWVTGSAEWVHNLRQESDTASMARLGWTQAGRTQAGGTRKRTKRSA